MKKLATLLIAAGLVFGASASANAIDFKAKGKWVVAFDYGQHGNFQKNQKNGSNGYNGKEDEFNAAQRFRIQLDAVASECLSGTLYFEIGGSKWGQAGNGAALGADDKVVKVKNAYLDWMVPETALKIRMGVQTLNGPSFALEHSQMFADDVAGVVASYQFNENVGLTAFWARPWNDNFDGKSYDADGSNKKEYTNFGHANYLDNIDMFGLILPLKFDGFKITPFGTIAAIGPNAFRKDKWKDDTASKNYFGGISGASKDYMASGMLPAWGVAGSKNKIKLSTYGTAWWAGFTADITAADPFHFALDFTAGGVQYEETRLNRAGWMVAGVAEYKMDWGTPGIVAWYASGDDDDLGNGSERLPYLSLNSGSNAFSDYAFDGKHEFTREGVIGESLSGLWGVGLRIKDISFIEDLKHTFRFTYMGGTNSSDVIKKLANDARYTKYQKDADGKAQISGGFGSYGVGVENLYLTNKDSAFEIGLRNEYKMYENFKVIFDANYVALNMASSSKKNLTKLGLMKNREAADAWNFQLAFEYQF